MLELSKAKENVIKYGCPSGLDLHPEFVTSRGRSVKHTIAVFQEGGSDGISLRHALSH